MNMISTGAFLNEMDASDKQSSLVSKLVTAWEKKNSKTARAGGVSLMALSLAACGSSDDEATSSSPENIAAGVLAAVKAVDAAATTVAEVKANAIASVDTTSALKAADGTTYATVDAAITSNDAAVTATAKSAADLAAANTAAGVKTLADQALAAKTTELSNLQALYDGLTKAKDSDFTAVDGETPATTSNNDAYAAVVSASNALNTFQSNDKLADLSATDADTLTVTLDGDMSVTPTISGIETINLNVDALSSGADVTDFDVALTNFSAGAVMNVDSVKSGSIINSVTFTGDKGHTINASTDFKTLTSALAADGDGIYNMSHVGDSVNPASVTVTGAADTVTVDGKGYLTVSAAAVTDLVNVTSVNDTTLTATATAGVFITAGGDVVLTDVDTATVVNITAGGSITAAATKVAAALTPTFTAGTTVDVNIDAATSLNVTGAKTITIEEDTTGTTLTLINATVKTEATLLNFDDADGVKTVSVAGDQDYTLQINAASLDAVGDILTLTDNTTAGTSTFKLVDAAGNVDAKSMTVDKVDLAIDNSAKTLTVKSGQAVTVSVDQTTTTSTIAGVAATASSNTATITLDDGTKSATTTAVDLTTFAVSSMATLTIDGSKDSLLSGGAETHNITTAAFNTADVTVTMGANNLGLLGTSTLGSTNTLTISGSGKVTGDASGVVIAKELDATKVSGVVTLATIESEELGTVKTGAGADVLTMTDSGTEADLVINTGAGNDKITLTDTDTTEGQSLTIDMGAGTSDELVLVASQQILTTGTDTVSITGVENLTYTSHATDSDINVSFFNNQTFSLKDSTAIANTFTLDVNASDTAIDLSGMTVTTANKSAVNGDTFVVDASTAGDDGITSIKGALVTKNTITANDLDATTIVGGGLADTLVGGNSADNITGGAGIDTITGDAGNDTLTGGAGADIFIVGAGHAGSSDTITDFVVGATNDDIHLSNGAIEAAVSAGAWSSIDDWSDIATSASGNYGVITGAFDLTGLTGTENILHLNGADVANAAALETALEVGGAYALTLAGTCAANDVFTVLYDNGVDSYFAAVLNSTSSSSTYGAGTLTAKHLLTFTGITDSSTIVQAQFADFIA
jgi:hypothetical protein